MPRFEVQLRYTTGFDTIEVTQDEGAAINAANGYRRRGYRARIVHDGEVCKTNPRARTLYVERRYSWGKFAFAPWRHPAEPVPGLWALHPYDRAAFLESLGYRDIA